jgi:triacylglycerol lipase
MPKLDFRPNKTSFDLVNAWATAKASELAYKPKAQVLKTLKSWGFPQARFFSRKGTQGFVAGNGELVLVAFRGTEPTKLKDWMTDAKIKKVSGKGGGHVHRGFKAALEAVSSDMAATVRRFRDSGQPVFVTGHSLGAALAGLAVAASKSERIEIAGLYTYGMPRVGNRIFAQKFKETYGTRTFRVVNNNDTVTRVPPRSFGYKHVGVVKYFDSKGRLTTGQTPWKRFLVRVKGQAVGRIKDFLKPGTDGLKDHGIKRYVKALTGTQPSRSSKTPRT